MTNVRIITAEVFSLEELAENIVYSMPEEDVPAFIGMMNLLCADMDVTASIIKLLLKSIRDEFDGSSEDHRKWEDFCKTFDKMCEEDFG